MSKRRVVITGLGAVTPAGCNVPSFWASLLEGRSGITPLTAFDSEGFSSKVAGQVKGFDATSVIGEKELENLDRFVQFALVAADEAIKSSGLDLNKEDLDRIGVLIGSGIGGLATIEAEKETLDARGPRRIRPHFIPALLINMAAGHVSMKYGLKGPNEAIVTACATGNHSIGCAFRKIQHGLADVMVAGGSEAAITPLGFGGFCAMRALSTRYNDTPEAASRPFDKGRDGFVMGEGAGVVVVEELERAKARGAEIYAEIVGFGETADAFHLTQPAPEGRGARKAIEAALKDAGAGPDEVDYINAHGTSTPVGDPRETEAIKAALGEHARSVPVSSTKSIIGHLLGAAGGVETVATALMLKHGVIHPTINYQEPDPECDLDYVPNEARRKRIHFALSNSLGFGGHNAILAFRSFEG